MSFFNENSIIETINMIKVHNLDIRTVTLALSLRDCCGENVREVGDKIYNKIIKYAKNSADKEFIVCTEDGVAFELERQNKDKKFYFPSPAPKCKDMKLNTVEKVLKVLESEENEIQVPLEISSKAIIPLNRMLELGK